MVLLETDSASWISCSSWATNNARFGIRDYTFTGTVLLVPLLSITAHLRQQHRPLVMLLGAPGPIHFPQALTNNAGNGSSSTLVAAPTCRFRLELSAALLPPLPIVPRPCHSLPQKLFHCHPLPSINRPPHREPRHKSCYTNGPLGIAPATEFISHGLSKFARFGTFARNH